ncbi:carbon-nitrogen hydrolase family protein [Sporolactobacillus sp. THM7-7]|nr:carbon-nitrogen hydrolase family protein [Sporolactobacillus sp. THM7-7]
MKVTVSCVQMEPKLLDVEYNLQKMCQFIDEIMERNKNTDLIIFPELITSGYECGNQFHNLAEIVKNGKSMNVIGKMAEKYDTNIIYGFPERDERSGDLYNSCVYISDKGKVEGVYRKVHLFDTEKIYFKKGSKFPIFNTRFGKIGIMICWDTAFPEVARIYALKGAELLVVSTNWEKPYSDDWDLVTRSRAFDNCVYLVAANRIGKDKKLSFFGHSKIIGPLGKQIKGLDQEVEGFISSELDLERSKQLRKQYYTFFEDRMPKLYHDLTES